MHDLPSVLHDRLRIQRSSKRRTPFTLDDNLQFWSSPADVASFSSDGRIVSYWRYHCTGYLAMDVETMITFGMFGEHQSIQN
jgi:hypothetical protein